MYLIFMEYPAAEKYTFQSVFIYEKMFHDSNMEHSLRLYSKP